MIVHLSGRVTRPIFTALALASLALSAPQSSGTTPDPAAIKLAAGRTYLRNHLWKNGLADCDAAAQLSFSPEVFDCIRTAVEEGRRQRREYLYKQLDLVDTEIEHKNFDAADNTLGQVTTRLAADISSLGPLSPGDEHELGRKRDWAVKAREKAANFPTSFAVSVLQVVETILLYIAILLVAYGVLVTLRAVLQFLWRHWDRPNYIWRVWTITDKTDQQASGAVMDALNFRLNPLFRPIETSSLLALPPGLDDEKVLSAVHIRTALRNFLISTQQVRPLVSLWMEVLPWRYLIRHRFLQVNAFEEDLTVKLGGVLEGSLSSFFRIPNRWFRRGMPAVTGAVSTIDMNDKKYVLIRLVGNWDRQGRRQSDPAKQYYAGPGVWPESLFSKEETLSAYASTEIQPAGDAVALSAHRAAFRFLYRLAIQFNQPNLAIAASSYIQGVRLLEFYLL